MIFKTIVFLASVLLGFNDEFSCKKPHLVDTASADDGRLRLTCLREEQAPEARIVDRSEGPIAMQLLWDRAGGVIYVGTNEDPFHVQIENRTGSLLFPASSSYGPVSVRGSDGQVISALHACRLFVERNQMQCGYISLSNGASIAVHDFQCEEAAD